MGHKDVDGRETTRWLTDDEQRIWRTFLDATTMLREHLERELQRDSGMPLAYYQVLVALSEAPSRRMRMSELAARCGASRSRLSHAVARMEAAGWVERSGCPTDKRGSLATLTERGFDALASAAPGHVRAVREELFDRLTGEQVATLGQIVTAVKDGLVERGADSVGPAGG
jgi:DNA-binding MarR family transcriptional regulator